MGMISSHIRSMITDSGFERLESLSEKQYREGRKDRWPAEIFRTDFITAMKIADNQMLPEGQHYELVDTWRQEWEKGVQVPIKPQEYPSSGFRKKDVSKKGKRCNTFSLPNHRITLNSPELCDQMEQPAGCVYDLDDLDVNWLQEIKAFSQRSGGDIDECIMEKSMTLFEKKCFDNMVQAVATRKGLSIEYDDSTTCDVCLSPDTEDSNEIVFCDACNMCVHQACYGISDIPSGTWLCRPCSRGVLSPPCVICPNKGGAMKRVKNSFEWIHVICAWWVPEVKIEDIEAVEQVTVDKIPASRKNLCCTLCRQKVGACIQCSVKRCVAAYHVTCAVKEGLEMKTLMLQEKDDVQHISFCKRHCIPQPSDKSTQRASTMLENQRMHELQILQEEFFKLVDLRNAARELRVTRNIAAKLFYYWILKRKASENKPLVPLTAEQQEKLSGKQGLFLIQEQIHVEMERYGRLRQDLERLRNLCYLIIRRERTKREVHRVSQEIFNKQDIILDTEKSVISEHDYNMFASGSKLMRFTRFPHYRTDGPPYFEHLHEDEIQEYDAAAHIDIEVEQSGCDPSSVNSSFGKLLTFDGYENKSSVNVSATNTILTGNAISAMADRCREGNQTVNLTSTMLAGSTISNTSPITATKVKQHHSDILTDYAQSFSETKQVPDECCKGIQNTIFEVSHIPEKVDVRGGTSVESAMFTNREIQSIAALGEMPGSFKQSESDTNQLNFLQNYASPPGSIAQRSFNEPGMSSGCSHKYDCSCKPCITIEANDDNSVTEMVSLGIKPSFKHGRKRRLADVTSKKLLCRSISLKQAPFESYEARTKASHQNLILNRVQPPTANTHLGSIRQLDNNAPNAFKCSTLPTSKSSMDGELQVMNNSSSFTIRKASTDLPSPTEKELGENYNHESVFLPNEVRKPSVVFVSDTDPCSGIGLSENRCSVLSISTPSVDTINYSDASQVVQHVSEEENMQGVITSSLRSPNSISFHASSNENFTIVSENGEECADVIDESPTIYPKVDFKNRTRYEKSLSDILPCGYEYHNNEYMEKADPTEIKTYHEDRALAFGTDKPSQSFKIKKSADFAYHDSIRSDIILKQSLPEGICESTTDTQMCHESPTSCSESILADSFGFLNANSSHVHSCDGKRQQPEDLAVRCSGSILPKASCLSFDISLRHLNEKTRTDRAALYSSDAVKSPFVLLNEVTHLKGAKLHSDHEMLHSSSPGYRRLSNIQIPSLTRSVIDDLTACPQRLTWGHTQLMMMQPNEQPSSSKREARTQKTVSETSTKIKIAASMPESESAFESLRLQDTGRIKVRPLGFVKSTPPDFQFGHLSTKQCSTPPELKTLSKSAILKVGYEDPVDQTGNDKNVTEHVINPTRLTRARAKSLGLQQYSSDDLVAV